MSFREHEHHHHQPKPYVEEEYYSEVCERERVPPSWAYSGRSEYEHEQFNGGRGHNNSGNNFKRNERLAELGAVAAGAFALYEEHKAKTDPERASKHQIEAGTAALGALGSAGYAYYEHRQKNKLEDGRW